MLTNIFTPTQCAACKLCCNFHRSSAWETPVLEDSLADWLQAQGIPLETRANGSVTFLLPFVSNDENEVCNCPMLDPLSGCTLPREKRPFECRIWPLRLMTHTDGRLVISLYKKCPALKASALQQLIRFATTELLPVLLNYAKNNPLSIRPLNPAYSIIWSS